LVQGDDAAIDFVASSRFTAPGVEGRHRVHDTQTKRLRHLTFFRHECYLEVRTPRVRLPDGRVVQIGPDWFGKLTGFTLLFEVLVLAMAQQMTFAAVARLVNESWHRVHAICSRYVDLATPNSIEPEILDRLRQLLSTTKADAGQGLSGKDA